MRFKSLLTVIAITLGVTATATAAGVCPDKYVTTTTDRFSGAATIKTSAKLNAFKHDKLSTATLSQTNGGTRLMFIFVITSQNKAKLTAFIQCNSVYILANDQIMETRAGLHGWREGQVNVAAGAALLR